MITKGSRVVVKRSAPSWSLFAGIGKFRPYRRSRDIILTVKYVVAYNTCTAAVCENGDTINLEYLHEVPALSLTLNTSKFI